MSESKQMVKSDKATILRRVSEVLRVVLAGGEFDEIRQYAEAQGWGVCDRQLRRYQEKAYERLAEHAQQDQKQLLGRHLMQRRALYARAIKTNDIRTALHVLRDEAELEGLYEYAKQQLSVGTTSSIPRDERLKRLLVARMKEDDQEIKFVEDSSPTVWYAMPDTRMSEMVLNTMAAVHTAEQLDRASMVLLAMWRIEMKDERYEFWHQIEVLHAWNFSVHREGWRLFVEDLGVEAEWLIRVNHQGSFLELFSDQLDALRPDSAEFKRVLESMGQSADELATADCVARGWRSTLDEVLRE